MPERPISDWTIQVAGEPVAVVSATGKRHALHVAQRVYGGFIQGGGVTPSVLTGSTLGGVASAERASVQAGELVCPAGR